MGWRRLAPPPSAQAGGHNGLANWAAQRQALPSRYFGRGGWSELTVQLGGHLVHLGAVRLGHGALVVAQDGHLPGRRTTVHAETQSLLSGPQVHMRWLCCCVRGAALHASMLRALRARTLPLVFPSHIQRTRRTGGSRHPARQRPRTRTPPRRPAGRTSRSSWWAASRSWPALAACSRASPRAATPSLRRRTRRFARQKRAAKLHAAQARAVAQTQADACCKQRARVHASLGQNSAL